MSLEVHLQIDLFTGQLIDARPLRQKNQDGVQPRQVEMFSQCELTQFGVKARPQMSITPVTRLELAREDPRTDEEKEQAAWREAEKNTSSMFEVSAVAKVDGVGVVC